MWFKRLNKQILLTLQLYKVEWLILKLLIPTSKVNKLRFLTPYNKNLPMLNKHQQVYCTLKLNKPKFLKSMFYKWNRSMLPLKLFQHSRVHKPNLNPKPRPFHHNKEQIQLLINLLNHNNNQMLPTLYTMQVLFQQ